MITKKQADDFKKYFDAFIIKEKYETELLNGSYHPNEVSVNEAKLNLK